eukprot:2679673-Prymnesium_polylepis.1
MVFPTRTRPLGLPHAPLCRGRGGAPPLCGACVCGRAVRARARIPPVAVGGCLRRRACGGVRGR